MEEFDACALLGSIDGIQEGELGVVSKLDVTTEETLLGDVDVAQNGTEMVFLLTEPTPPTGAGCTCALAAFLLADSAFA